MYRRLQDVAGEVPVALYVMHVIAVVVHVVTLAVCMGALASKGSLPLYRSNFVYAPKNTSGGGLFNPGVEVTPLGRFHFWPIVLGFIVPSIVEHAVYVVMPGLYGRWMSCGHMGTVRFTSYAFSAPLMVWATNYLCGIGEPLILCTCASLVVVMLAIGYVLAPGDPTRYMAYGVVGFLAAFVAFLPGIFTAAMYDDLPGVVAAIIAMMVLLYLSFGAVFVCSNYFKEDHPYLQSEYAYAGLSLTSKVFLAFMITFGVVARA